ncbi:metalloregulator ArsR/SmtB family transcription factor [Parvularcula sp. ZS-1/3]|uniref:Metalloregulator ArsR/SmtB family transcription factor n=1 Tax=Parvularcula mediterranea TaxID=2732508 RepID=A0A7Y3W5E8_9PROT|nr:metalloregulator ArsR/SmtB family transcription factor [Parvularcula mediterranea]
MEFATGLEQLRAAGEETRLRVLCLLRQSDLTVTELTQCLDQLQPRVSRHLRILVDAGLVSPYQEGSWRFYRLAEQPDWLEALVGTLEGEEVEALDRALTDVRAERARRAQAYFADNADDWDALRRLHTDDRLIEEAMLELAPDRVDGFVDLGTGTGRMLTLFAGRYREASGYDLSPEMLEVARVKLEEAKVRNAIVRRRDILKHDQIPPASADVVTLHHVLHFLGEPERAVEVAAATLRPGGALLIADFAEHAMEELRERYAHRRLGFSTQEIDSFARRARLLLREEIALEPGDGGLVSKIWRLDKPLSSVHGPSQKETALV